MKNIPRRFDAPWPVPLAVLGLLAVFVSLAITRFRGYPIDYKTPIDLEVYVQGGLLALHGTDLYANGVPAGGITLPFTYPPFAALVFATFSWLPFPLIVIGYYIAGIGCAVLIARWLKVNPLLMLVLLMCTQPGFASFSFGQVNLFLMTLILADAVDKRPSWLPRGALIGIAAAIKVTPAIFLLWFLVRRDTRGFLGVLAGGAAATLLAAAIKPQDTWTYFTSALLDPNRVGGIDYIHNASLTGVLARLGMESMAKPAIVLALIFGAWVAYRVAKQGDDLLALCIVAAIGLLVSPISWTHHFTWLPVLLIVGIRAGMPHMFGWWIVLATTLGLLVTSAGSWIAAVGVAQYSLVLLAVFIYFARAESTAKATTPASA